jgi:hypothetical protein
MSVVAPNGKKATSPSLAILIAGEAVGIAVTIPLAPSTKVTGAVKAPAGIALPPNAIKLPTSAVALTNANFLMIAPPLFRREKLRWKDCAFVDTDCQAGNMRLGKISAESNRAANVNHHT